MIFLSEQLIGMRFYHTEEQRGNTLWTCPKVVDRSLGDRGKFLGNLLELYDIIGTLTAGILDNASL